MDVSLNLPPFNIKVRTFKGQKQLFDAIRAKYVALTPEEWVRQHFINYLLEFKGFPKGLIAVEFPIIVNSMQQRVDVVVFNKAGKPTVIIECKAPDISLAKNVFEQAARYNLTLKAGYLIITNGITHYCSRIDLETKQFTLLGEVPDYSSL